MLERREELLARLRAVERARSARLEIWTSIIDIDGEIRQRIYGGHLRTAPDAITSSQGRSQKGER